MTLAVKLACSGVLRPCGWVRARWKAGEALVRGGMEEVAALAAAGRACLLGQRSEGVSGVGQRSEGMSGVGQQSEGMSGVGQQSEGMSGVDRSMEADGGGGGAAAGAPARAAAAAEGVAAAAAEVWAAAAMTAEGAHAFAALMDKNFELRRQMFGDDALGAVNLDMVAGPRDQGRGAGAAHLTLPGLGPPTSRSRAPSSCHASPTTLDRCWWMRWFNAHHVIPMLTWAR